MEKFDNAKIDIYPANHDKICHKNTNLMHFDGLDQTLIDNWKERNFKWHIVCVKSKVGCTYLSYDTKTNENLKLWAGHYQKIEPSCPWHHSWHLHSAVKFSLKPSLRQMWHYRIMSPPLCGVWIHARQWEHPEAISHTPISYRKCNICGINTTVRLPSNLYTVKPVYRVK